MKNINQIVKPDFKKFPIQKYLEENSINSLFKEYNLSNFFFFKREIKSLIINILNKILRNKINLNNSRSLKKVKEKYDRIAGSYVKTIEDKNSFFFGELNDSKVVECKGNIHIYYADVIGKIISQTKSKSFLEVGAGELTFFKLICDFLKKKKFKINETAALDISYERLLIGKKFLKKHNNKINHIVQGNAAQLPFADNSFDLIYTSHCLEQVPDLFENSMKEMLRVAKKYVVLIEPSYELSNKITKNYIYYKGYIQITEKLLRKIKHKYFKRIKLPFRQFLNGTELIIYKKKNKKNKNSKVKFICPKTKQIIYKKKNTLKNHNTSYKIQNKIYRLIREI